MKQKIPKLLPILEKTILDEVEKRRLGRKNYPYRHNPSSASIKVNGKVEGQCLRKLYYKATKEEETNKTDFCGIMRMGFGDAIHYYLSQKFKKAEGMVYADEVGTKFNVDELTQQVSYRMDGLISMDGSIGGCELKTVQGQAITGKGWGIKAKGPKLDHLLQIICYFKADKNLKWFSLIYVARDNAYPIEFSITYDHDKDVISVNGKAVDGATYKGILARWVELEDCLKKGIAPPRDFKVWLKDDGTIQATKQIKGVMYKSDFHCNYCPFKDKCWKEKDAIHYSLNNEV
jgi:hypothetical protein